MDGASTTGAWKIGSTAAALRPRLGLSSPVATVGAGAALAAALRTRLGLSSPVATVGAGAALAAALRTRLGLSSPVASVGAGAALAAVLRTRLGLSSPVATVGAGAALAAALRTRLGLSSPVTVAVGVATGVGGPAGRVADLRGVVRLFVGPDGSFVLSTMRSCPLTVPGTWPSRDLLSPAWGRPIQPEPDR